MRTHRLRIDRFGGADAAFEWAFGAFAEDGAGARRAPFAKAGDDDLVAAPPDLEPRLIDAGDVDDELVRLPYVEEVGAGRVGIGFAGDQRVDAFADLEEIAQVRVVGGRMQRQALAGILGHGWESSTGHAHVGYDVRVGDGGTIEW